MRKTSFSRKTSWTMLVRSIADARSRPNGFSTTTRDQPLPRSRFFPIARTIGALRELRALGVHLAIDGFGAGFSSLAHLRQLPVDTLKIDLSFVRGATTDADDASVVTAVIAVAHSLGLKVVAQGVETEAQVSLLRSLRCDFVQGYLWSPPLPAEECERILAEGILPAPAARQRAAAGRSRRPRAAKKR